MKRLRAFARCAAVGLLVAATLPSVMLLTLSAQGWYLGEQPLDREELGFFVVCFGGPAVVLVLLGATTQSICGSSSLWPVCLVALASLPVTLATARYLTLHYVLDSVGLFLILCAGFNAAGAAVTACGVVSNRTTTLSPRAAQEKNTRSAVFRSNQRRSSSVR